MVDERLPPQNIEAEQSVLGSILLEKDAIIKVADILKSEDFYREDHGTIYASILKLFEGSHAWVRWQRKSLPFNR